jgi:hypothetical protein
VWVCTVRAMRAALLTTALVLALSGCGSDSSEPPPDAVEIPSLTPTDGSGSDPASPTPTATADPGLSRQEVKAARRTFDTWLGAFGDGNADRACPLQTDSFTQQQVKRLAEKDRIQRGASCRDLLPVIGILFDALQIDVADAHVERGPSEPDEIAFSVKFDRFATLGYGLIKTKQGWRVNEDLIVG